MTILRQYRKAFGGCGRVAGQSFSGLPVFWQARSWVLALCIAFIVGCATSPAYKSLFAVGHAVDTSVDVYFDLVVKGVVPTNDVPKVARAYNAFQLVYSNAVVLVKFNSKAPPDTNIIAKAGEMLSIVAKAQGVPR